MLGKVLLLLLIAFTSGIAFWEIVYHAPAEPKDLRYRAWKLGLYPMDPDKALETMVGDGDPEKNPVVIGKTREELIAKFGFVTTLDSTIPYNRFCYDHSDYYRGKPVLFLRKSNWMAVLNNGKAVDLVLMKGC